MECYHFESPISTLKVDFGCSKHCPTDVKKMLQQLKGVKSISIDPSEGKVTVIGNANPMMLVELLKKMGKKAELWSFDRAPMKGKSGSHCCCGSDSEEDDCDHDSNEEEESICWEHPKFKAFYGQKSNKKENSWKDWFRFDNKDRVQSKSYSLSSPPLPSLIAGHYSPMSWNGPVTNANAGLWYNYYGRNPAVLHTYRQLSSRLLTKYNPMVQYTSYADNYRFTM